MRRRRAIGAWSAAVAAAALLAACGEDEAKTSGGPISLTVRYDDGAGAAARTGRLVCDGEQRAAGALAGPLPAARLCEQARAIAPLLTGARPGRQACTQLYGGPQTVRVRGTIDGRAFDRRFKRTNGCEIEEYRRVATALPARS